MSLLEQISVKIDSTSVLSEKMAVLRDVWEETSFQLELLQANPECVTQERDGLKNRHQPQYKLTFDPDIVHIVPQGKVIFISWIFMSPIKICPCLL